MQPKSREINYVQMERNRNIRNRFYGEGERWGAGSFVVRRWRDVVTKNKRKSSPIDCVSAELREPSCSVTSTS